MLPGGFGSPEFITLTVGALDAGIGRAILECVYETCPPDDTESCVTCETRLDNVDRNIGVMVNSSKVSGVIKAAVELSEIDPTYVLVTGYPAYWNVDGVCRKYSKWTSFRVDTLETHKATLRQHTELEANMLVAGFSPNMPPNTLEYLSKDLRTRMND